MRIAVLITVFNRIEKTLLYKQELSMKPYTP